MKKYSVVVLIVMVLTVLVGCFACAPAADEPDVPPVAPPEEPKDPYIIGVSAALTGPFAATYAPILELYRVYMERLNDEGGIDGHLVEIIYNDDRGETGVAATNAKRYVEKGANLMVVISGSPTYAPMIAEAKAANIPILIGGAGAMAAMPPDPDPLVFAILSVSLQGDSSKGAHTLTLIGDPATMKVGGIIMDIPVAMAAASMFPAFSEAWGIADTVMVPVAPTVVDLAPIASDFIEQEVNWITEFGPGRLGKRLYEAMTKLGWEGNLLTLYDVPEVLNETQSENIFVNFYVDPVGTIPIHTEIYEAAEKYQAKMVTSFGLVGWTQGMLTEQILREAGWPVTTEKILANLSNWEGIRTPLSGNIQYTPTDHMGPIFYRTFTWSDAEQDIVPATNWFEMDSQGKEAIDLGDSL